MTKKSMVTNRWSHIEMPEEWGQAEDMNEQTNCEWRYGEEDIVETGVQTNEALKLRPCCLLLYGVMDLQWPVLSEKENIHIFRWSFQILTISSRTNRIHLWVISLQILAEGWRNWCFDGSYKAKWVSGDLKQTDWQIMSSALKWV